MAPAGQGMMVPAGQRVVALAGGAMTPAGGAMAPAGQRVIEVPETLARVLPEGGLRRGSLVSVEAAVPSGRAVSGGTALALALSAVATRSGSWCAAVGLPELGLVAAQQLGVCLDRFALVPRPGPQWAVVAAALLEGADLLLVRPPSVVSPGDARRLLARARERDAVLMVAGSRRWPEAAELRLQVVASSWTGLGQGRGYLGDREVEVAVTGRRAAARERRCRLLLPGPDGGLAESQGGLGEDAGLKGEVVMAGEEAGVRGEEVMAG